MRRAALVLASSLVVGCASSPEEHTAAPGAGAESGLSLERLLSRPPLTGTAPSSPLWSPDSKRLAFRWNDAAGSRRDLWLVEADGTGLRRLIGDDDERHGIGGIAWMPDGQSLLFLRGGDLWRTDLEGRTRQISSARPSARNLTVSPDGRYASVLHGGDLWLCDLAVGGPFRQVTEVGVPTISRVPFGRYRRAEVEIGTGIWGGPTYAWSPDSRHIAVHHVDRREVRKVPFPNYLGRETDPNLVRRGYPGDPNERRRVGIVDVAGNRDLTFLDLPDPTANAINSFTWSAQGQLLIDRASDTAVDRWLHVYDPESGQLQELWSDRRESRIYTTMGSEWHPDGEHVIVLGDLADRYGLYAVSAADPEPLLLTQRAFDVTGGPLVTGDGGIFYPANEPSPYERHVFRTSLARREPMRVTNLPGDARPYPSPDGRRLAFLHSSDDTPTELYLVDTAGAVTARRITHSPPPEFEEHEWGVARYLSFPSLVDDATLHARILQPRNLEPGRRYPVIFGPVYSNTVRNRWAGFYGNFQHLLVARGYIVVQVDVRGSTGYGRAFREQFLTDFAGRDLDDLESAVAHLETLDFVDPDRIGIWGSSYGGTLTVYALLKRPGLFNAGVAAASAVDPRFFGSDDVAIVRRPDTHPAAFERGAVQYAANLEDPLLLIHGMQDHVVPFKTVVVLAEALMREGKDFDFAFAPAGTHGWRSPPHYARYLLGKLLTHFDRHLGPGPR